jgi:hypothetical protein
MRGAWRTALGLLAALTTGPARATECEPDSFSSTFELIEQRVFVEHGCTSAFCHDGTVSGGLDLRPGLAYDGLVDVPAESVPNRVRVVAGQKDQSLLWLNLAAKTFPDQWTAPLRSMPIGLPAVLPERLEAVRRWIEAGAPRTGVVPETDELLDACLPPPEPIAIKPLPPPPPGTGVQIRMPRTIVRAGSEHEICHAAYYDVTEQVPAEFRGADGESFRYRRVQGRQDPLSHHLIAFEYRGDTPLDDARWGAFRCRGGARDGEPCDPLDPDFCGADGGCGSEPRSAVACIGYGPGDSPVGLGMSGLVILQETAGEFNYPDGVYAELPLKGVLLWNSHAFNLTATDGKLEAWLNFEFAPPDEQAAPAIQINDVSEIFSMAAPAFGTDEACNIFTFPANARLYELSSHMHQRGKRFRIFDGAWRCGGTGRACSPFGPDFASRDRCGGAPCVSTARPRCGDCNWNDAVTVDELVTGVEVALGAAPLGACEDADADRDGAVRVHEVITAVNAAVHGVPDPAPRDAEESLIYVSLVYNDPVVLRFDPERVYPTGAAADERSLTYCALYDNGYTDPDTVKRRSASPDPPPGFSFIGGPCRVPTGCTAGRVGMACSGRNDAERNAACDSSPGAGDGFCDACPLGGGVTTEDEMLVLFGEYYLP